MDEKRESEITRAFLKRAMRREMAFRDIANVKRSIGNIVNEPEMLAIKAKSNELLTFSKSLLEEIFTEEMKAIS